LGLLKELSVVFAQGWTVKLRHDGGYGAQDGFLEGAEGLGAGESGTADEADGAGGWDYNLFSTDNRVRTWRFSIFASFKARLIRVCLIFSW